jgi:serine protease Do
MALFIVIVFVCVLPCFTAEVPVEKIANHAGQSTVENSFVNVVRDVGPSVVSIRAETMVEGIQLQGQDDGIDEKMLRQFLEDLLKRKKHLGTREASGLIISAEGHILTNYHVVADATKILVNLHDGTVLEGSLIGSDSRTDLAVVRVKADGLKVPRFGDSDTVEPGEWAIAIGSPYGFERSVTLGVISAKSRPGLNNVTPAGELIQTDASINPGNSGGPLVNIRGEVIGINSIVIRPGQGIGFAIPINMIKKVMEDLVKAGRVLRPWLGIGLQEINPEMKKYYGLSGPGTLVRQVVEEGPSEKAGLEAGDIITSIEGKEAVNPQCVLNGALDKRIGQTIKVEAIRNGKRFNATIIAGDEESYHKVKTIDDREVEAGGPFGLVVKTITPGIARKLNHPELEGVVITGVQNGSCAHAASLMTDDAIIRVDGKSVKDEDDYQSAIKKSNPEKGSLMMVDRGGSTFFVVLKEEAKR